MDGHPIILFDGVCNFCNRAINFVIKRDKNSIIRFATLQSNFSKQLLESKNFQPDEDSFALIENNKIFLRSTAALKVFRYLKGLWPLIYGLIIVPKFVRDRVYDLIAKNRYNWFGKRDECMVPTANVRSRFLNETT
jgi:predicted DCC family thiol-disulfide oxidoreductase YuxK